MNVRLHFLFTLLTASLIPQTGGAQELSTDVRQKIGKFLDATARKEVSVGRIRIDSVSIEGNTLQLFANMNCAYIPFREDNVTEIYQGVQALLPAEFSKYNLQIRTNRINPPSTTQQKGQKSQNIQSGRDKTFSNGPFYPLYPYKWLKEPSHCLVAESRLLL